MNEMRDMVPLTSLQLHNPKHITIRRIARLRVNIKVSALTRFSLEGT